MSDLGSQLREYVETVAPSISEEEVTSVQVPPRRAPTRTRRYVWSGLAVTGLVVILSLGLLLSGESVRQKELVAPGDVDACQLLIRATARAGQPEGTMTETHPSTPWDADVCVHDGWDSGWDFRHILVRKMPTTLEEAELILERPDLFESVLSETEVRPPLQWSVERPGLWTTRGEGFYAAAAFSEPYFLIVTYRGLDEAQALAEAAMAELENEPLED